MFDWEPLIIPGNIHGAIEPLSHFDEHVATDYGFENVVFAVSWGMSPSYASAVDEVPDWSELDGHWDCGWITFKARSMIRM